MSRRSAISDMISRQLAAANSAAPEPSPTAVAPRVGAGPVRSMGLTLDRLQQEERALRDALASGAAVVDLDPLLISASFAADRFETEEADGGALRRSIAEHGQDSPILVRPHPDDAGRFQVAYGHRRLRACQALGRKVRAVVRPLTDAELVVAQGAENAARVDLSFIEKATFARTLEDRGFERAVIMQALATDKTELSKLITAARGLPDELTRAIGAAPKAGRRRWTALAEALAKKPALERARKAVAAAAERGEDSDARFAAAFAAATRADRPATVEAPCGDGAERLWRAPSGRPLLRAQRKKSGLVLSIANDAAPGFDEFLLARLDALIVEFGKD